MCCRARLERGRGYSAMPDQRVAASAPGKLVLCGEYAVLAGAPALVLAVDRRVSCTLEPQAEGDWQIVSRGFAQQVTLTKEEVFAAPPGTTAGILREAMPPTAAPRHLRVTVDSTACYQGGVKLGIGSSAATVTALASAAATLAGGMATLPQLTAIHARMQGGGSGLDVAAAVAGGLIRFQQGRVSPARLPAGTQLAFVFTGTSTPTAELLAKYHAWRNGTQPPALTRLLDAAHEAAHCVADCTVTAETFVAALGDYAAALERFDRAADIGVFGAAHRQARALAASCGVVYKPCGAGGGDMGVAASADGERLAVFRQALGDTDLTLVDMELDANGVVVRTG